ncbi:MAG: tRNA pseudouridine(38-40) synthase TruA [Synergistaceae bacterium]|jgi:tRNA pseudouridine38-40 synthase|nr:tRNA pseudouridine(38-40) synthase TruA [Synergistaceae bacterium]
MARIALEISYDGSRFAGWQSQPGGKGVQDAMENALRKLGESARVFGAGRTDAGVHARAQVAHFDSARDWEPGRLVLAVNAWLPESVSVMRAHTVRDTFDARRSAAWREYRYFIWNSPVLHPYIRPYVFRLPGSHYNWNRASASAGAFVGEHDFRLFCRAADRPENTVRTVRSAALHRRGSLVVFRIVANAYLTNMVRIAAGGILDVAAGRRGEEWLRSLLDGGDVPKRPRTLPASGLFLWRVLYDEGALPSR